jgi:Domain of unknown function (DUF6379)
MYEKHMIMVHDFKNVTQNGQTTGFQINIRINYYRGVYLSQVDTLKLIVDGEEIPHDRMTFTVRQHGPDVASDRRTFTFAELPKTTTVRWYFGDPATLTIAKPGGLKPGSHTVQLGLFIRNSYRPRVDKEALYATPDRPVGPDGITHYGEPPAELPLTTKKMTLVQ